ncbi:MAG: mechanosensitive ion channel family protein [Bacteroidales bacterium]|nr:mechanosensitive ion channel family protein [Bacteroidales bacterium]
MKDVFNKELILDLWEKIQDWVVQDLPLILILTIALIVLLRVIRFAIKRLKKSIIKHSAKIEKVDIEESEKRINTLTGIVWGLLRIILWTIYIMLILQQFGVNIAPILASAGILGLAVGFGAQELVRDFISGFFILLEDQVRTGDVAIIDGTSGLVEKIELRTITLRDFSGTVHIFQNGKIGNLSNMTKEWSAMLFDIGVAYKENTQQVMDLMKQVGYELQNDPEFKDDIIEPIEVFGLDEFGDSALIIKARIKTKPIQQWSVGREYRKRLKEVFDKHNIEIPFPHTTLYWGEEISPLKIDLEKTAIKSQ